MIQGLGGGPPHRQAVVGELFVEAFLCGEGRGSQSRWWLGIQLHRRYSKCSSAAQLKVFSCTKSLLFKLPSLPPYLDDPGQPKVGNLDLNVVANENVPGGEVPVNELPLLQVGHSRRHLPPHVDQLRLGVRQLITCGEWRGM